MHNYKMKYNYGTTKEVQRRKNFDYPIFGIKSDYADHNLVTDKNQCASFYALGCKLPPTGAAILSTTADIDVVASMAIIEARAGWYPFIDISSVIFQKYYTHWKPKNKKDIEDEFYIRYLSVIAENPRRKLVKNVHDLFLILTMKNGAENHGLANRIDSAKRIAARQIKRIVSVTPNIYGNGQISWLDGHDTMIDACHKSAPIAVVHNPSFSIRGNDPHSRFTISQHSFDEMINFDFLVMTLNVEETHRGGLYGWSGSSNMIHSPKGVSSKLTMNEVLEITNSMLP